MPAPFYPIALDLNSATGEPAVAWGRKSASPGPSPIFYARHSGGAWTTQQVDTTSSSWLNVALGIDAGGRPHIAWARPRADAVPSVVLTYGEGAGPDGPFTAAVVDSQFSTFLTMAIDRSNGEPRLVYVTAVPTQFSTDRRVRYAYRVPGDSWQWVDVTVADNTGNPAGPALTLDPAGNPFISFTENSPIEPALAADPNPSEIEVCGGVSSDAARIFYRAGGEGQAPFSVEQLAWPDDRSGVCATASKAVGSAIVVWRTRISCPPFGLTTTTVTGPSLVGVDRNDARGVALSPVWPNPARSGDDLRVECTLAREGAIALELHDLVGRRVAFRSLARVSPGPHAISWAVPDLAPGHYWLTVRSDGQRMGTRSVVILR
jgi:hypothetical protein